MILELGLLVWVDNRNARGIKVMERLGRIHKQSTETQENDHVDGEGVCQRGLKPIKIQRV